MKAIQLKITLDDTSPAVWRRVLVLDNTSMRKLHEVLNLAMGWTISHLHMFKVEDTEIGNIDYDDFDELGEMLDDTKMKLKDLLKKTQSFKYLYDFGDGWEHTVEVEQVIDADPNAAYPICLDGENACPPEDVGGTGGFENFKKAMANPRHPEHREYKTWVGGKWDTKAFDPRAVNSNRDFKKKRLVAQY